MRRRYRWILGTLVAGFVTAGLMIALLLYTSFGLSAIVLPAVASVTGVDINADQLRGSIAGGLRARRLSVSTEDMQLKITDLVLEWRPWDLLTSEVNVDLLSAATVSVQVEELSLIHI